MIRFLDSEPDPGFLSALYYDTVTGNRIYTLYNLYGYESRNVMFWVQLDEDNAAVAVLAGDGDALHICASDNADVNELEDFIHFMGFRTVYTSANLSSVAGMSLSGTVNVMSYTGSHVRLNDLDSPMCETPRRLMDVYSLLSDCDESFAAETSLENWYAHTSLLLRRGFGHCLGLYNNGKLVSTAGVYVTGQSHAIIGGVATLPEYRGQGYAGALISHLVSIITGENRVPVVLVEDINHAAWYNSLGFIPCGETYELKSIK